MGFPKKISVRAPCDVCVSVVGVRDGQTTHKQHNPHARHACNMRGIGMSPRRPARSARRLVALIVGVTVVPLATLLWLGWRLAEQDRVLEHQQVQQRVERAADLIVAALQRAGSRSTASPMAADWPHGAVAVVFRWPATSCCPRHLRLCSHKARRSSSGNATFRRPQRCSASCRRQRIRPFGPGRWPGLAACSAPPAATRRPSRLLAPE